MPDPLLAQLEKHSPAEPESMDFVDLLLLLSQHRRLLGKVFVGALIFGVALAFLWPVRYKATARLLPPSQGQNSAAALLGQLAGGAAGSGANSGAGGAASSLLSGALNLKNPSDVYVAMLKSRTLEDKLIDRFDLRKLYSKKTYADTRKKLESNTDISTGKEGVITVDFKDADPNRARDIAKAYVDELLTLSETIAVTEAGQRRIFYDRELTHQRERLSTAETELKRVQLKTGMIAPSDQSRVIIESAARLRAMITAKQVEIGSMRAFASPANPDLRQAEVQLAELQAQLAKVEKNQSVAEGDFMLPTAKVPESAMEFLRAYREFRYQEGVFELLAKQLELARIDEARDVAALQVLDWPVAPDKRATPYRSLIVALCALAGLIGAVAFVLLEHQHARHLASPSYALKIEKLKGMWSRP